MIQLITGAGIRTRDLLTVSLPTLPLDQGIALLATSWARVPLRLPTALWPRKAQPQEQSVTGF